MGAFGHFLTHEALSIQYQHTHEHERHEWGLQLRERAFHTLQYPTAFILVPRLHHLGTEYLGTCPAILYLVQRGGHGMAFPNNSISRSPALHTSGISTGTRKRKGGTAQDCANAVSTRLDQGRGPCKRFGREGEASLKSHYAHGASGNCSGTRTGHGGLSEHQKGFSPRCPSRQLRQRHRQHHATAYAVIPSITPPELSC